MRTIRNSFGSLAIIGGLVALLSFVYAKQTTMPNDRGDGGTNGSSYANYTPPDYGTNLWLSISLSNSVVNLLLHNTQPGVPYLIRSREDLVSGSWFSEGMVTGASAATTMPAIINISERPQSLFFQALAWPASNGIAKTTPMLAVGGERIMELTTNGDVVSWGGNKYGELGDYTHLDSANPVHVVGLTNIVKIASGLNHSLAIDAKWRAFGLGATMNLANWAMAAWRTTRMFRCMFWE